MTDHSATPVHYPPQLDSIHPLVLQPIVSASEPQGSILGCIIAKQQTTSEVISNHTPALSSNFICIMDQIRMHLEAQVVQAGWLRHLVFHYNDFADLFNDVPHGEARVAVFRALDIWYRAVYIRQRYWETIWRDLYEDTDPLTKQQEVAYFQNMRSGVSAYNRARWRELFLHRNWGLVSKVAKFYRGKFHDMIDWDRRNQELPTEWELLLSAGYEGLQKAVDKFKPELGWKFSTHAEWWIRGSITALFKRSKTELRKKSAMDGAESYCLMQRSTHAPRLPEDYLELSSAVEQALERLNDSRKSQMIILRYGLFGKEEQTLKAIGQPLDITPQRVDAILRASLKQLKKDRPLWQCYMDWFGKW